LSLILRILLIVIVSAGLSWILPKLIGLVARFAKKQRNTTTLPRHIARETMRVDTEKGTIQRLLEDGMYEAALGLGRKPRPVDIKNKVIELRETYPDLSPLVVEAEDALVRSSKQYEKDCRFRDNIRNQICQKWGEVALEIFPGAQVWQMVREKPLVGKSLTSFIIKQMEGIVSKLPALEISKGSEVTALVVRLDCPTCNGGKNPPACKACGGTGKIKPTAHQSSLYVTLDVRCTYCEGTGKLSSASVSMLFNMPDLKTLDKLGILSRQNWIDILDDRGVCPVCGGSGRIEERERACTICNGTGKHCECNQKVTFHIPPKAKEGLVIKGEGSSSDRSCFARLVK